MRSHVQVTLFPFLSVLLCTMGILAFLAVTFLLFTSPGMAPPEPVKPVEVRWVGAPSYVRPLLVECRKDAVRFHSPGAPGVLTFTRKELLREARIVRELQDIGLNEMGPTAERYEVWFMMKALIENEERLTGGLTRALHEVEVGNIRAGVIRRERSYYPILLVYPEGIDTYDLVAYLVQTTTRFPIGAEPMLKGWKLPYQDLSS